jgi:hypothetical protein
VFPAVTLDRRPGCHRIGDHARHSGLECATSLSREALSGHVAGPRTSIGPIAVHMRTVITLMRNVIESL